jgi:hypothetical protein
MMRRSDSTGRAVRLLPDCLDVGTNLVSLRKIKLAQPMDAVHELELHLHLLLRHQPVACGRQAGYFEKVASLHE